jgi:hypothetical protein
MTTEEAVKTTQDGAIALAEEAASREDAEIVALVASADELTITTSEEMTASGALLKTVMARQKALTELRLSITRPMDKAKKRVLELFAPALDRLTNAEHTIKGAVLTYTREQERLRREAQAELDAAAERERLRLLESAEEHRGLAQGGEAAELEREAETVQAPTVAPAEAPSGQMHVRVTWHAEVTDLAALAKAYAEGEMSIELMLPNMKLLNEMARTFKGDLTVPGVRAVSEEGIAARA